LNRKFDGGKDQVLFNLLKGFRELGKEDSIVLFTYDDMAEVLRAYLPGSEQVSFVRGKAHHWLQALLLRTFVLPRRLRAVGVSVIFFPKSLTGLWPLRVPSIVLPHDIQSKIFPERFRLRSRLLYRAGYIIDFTLRDRIVAISDHDSDQMIHHYPGRAHKILRIYDPIDLSFLDAAGEATVPPSPYIIAVNILHPHKNTLTLIKAFEQVKDEIPHHKLLLVGRQHDHSRGLQEYVERQNLGSRVVFTGHVEVSELAALLKGADLFVNPSLFEGFGMTPIEAMGAGVPVLTSTSGAMPETTMGLVNYYEPAESPEALAASMLNLLCKEANPADLKAAREAVRKRYDYVAIAKEYWELFEEIHQE
jgi:glycosyltransferase involved in cell wall biosynthesis